MMMSDELLQHALGDDFSKGNTLLPPDISIPFRLNHGPCRSQNKESTQLNSTPLDFRFENERSVGHILGFQRHTDVGHSRHLLKARICFSFP